MRSLIDTRIDCHSHVGVNSRNIQRKIYPIGNSYEELLAEMDSFGITKAIVFPFPYSSILPSLGRSRYYGPGRFAYTKMYVKDNFDLVSEARLYENRVIPFPMLNPTDRKCLEHIGELAGHHIRGLKLHPIAHNYQIHLLVDHPLTRIIQDLGLIVSLHIGTGKEGAKSRSGTLDHALELARANPSIQFIFCHLGRLHKALPEAMKLENVLFDTSSLSLSMNSTTFIAEDPLLGLRDLTPRHVIERLVEMGYEDRLVWGSDEPYTPYTNELDYVENSLIPESAKQKILAGNVDRILK